MSHLRRIMQKLAQVQPDGKDLPHTPSAGWTQPWRLHVEDYQQRLQSCTAAMLQYEWAWLEEHIADLELGLSQPEMLATLGGKSHVEHMLLESRACLAVLKTQMLAQGVEPARHPQATVSGEHAWEIRQDSIRRLWGLPESSQG